MHAITNNLAISNFQANYNRNQMGHDMSKMNEVSGKDQMKANCNMQGMHQNSTTSSADKSNSSNNAVDSNLGRTIDAQV